MAKKSTKREREREIEREMATAEEATQDQCLDITRLIDGDLDVGIASRSPSHAGCKQKTECSQMGAWLLETCLMHVEAE